jgi:hypothetical protein
MVNRAPQPQDIVGLWQRIGITQLVGNRIDERKSNLFRADGTGIQKARHRFAGQDHDIPPQPFRWRYEGDGSWSSTMENPQARFRIAGDKLLYYLDTPSLKIRHVYSR